jgi:flagellar hook-associated protein 3 FlgL
MRVIFSDQFRDAASAIGVAASKLAQAQQQVSSGLRISKPSDDPAGAAAAVTDHATLGTIDAYTQTADTATSRLTVIDSTLSDIIDKLSAAQTAAASARGTVPTQGQRDAAAATLQGISDALVSDFNAQFHGAYLFSGTAATTAPFTVGAGGVVSGYQGNTASASVNVGQGHTLQVAFDGSSIAQGGAASDVFTVLSNLVTAVKAGDDAGIAQGMAALDAATSRATLTQTQVGTGLNALDDVRTRLTNEQLSTTAHLSKTEDADMASALTQMSAADTAYRAALGAASKLGSTSLMDYLR